LNAAAATVELTPKQVRAARALLAWSQQDLAKAARVATSTIADFERGQRTPVANNIQAIRAALEGADIKFLPGGAVIGPAPPSVTSARQPGAPIRWVDAEDLATWANRNDGATSLPTLIAQLVRATHGPTAHIHFPSDESVRSPGWDGRTITETGSDYVPRGDAGWELSSQRSQVALKASEDYRKRTAKPTPLDRSEATYVFVTPRRWPQKDAWAKARREEGDWRDVRVYDANDLVHWIEQTPAVGLWLATRLGKRPPGIRELQDVWEEWSLATRWPLTEELVRTDRDEDATEIRRWLRKAPSVMSVQASTTDEAVAFFHAALSELPDDWAAWYRAHCVVATSADGARALMNSPTPLILVLTEPEPGLAKMLVQRGHQVLQVYDDRHVARAEVLVLARPSRDGIAAALTAAGIPERQAHALARDSARNLAVLRRLIEAAPGRRPWWAEEVPPRGLLAALLAGGWDEDAASDREKLAEIADQPYEAVVANLARYVGQVDSPLQKVGSTWRVASPLDAWFLLARNLTGPDIARFEAAAHEVLGSPDPRFELEANERWMASVKGIHPKYSGMLRHGLGQVLILLALWGDEVRTVSAASRRADHIVSRLLRGADKARWWSLSRDFRLLAEASPKAFLDAIEESLDADEPPIRALFEADKGGLFATEHLSDLLWALESLAWSPDLMPRVSHVLARLDAIDEPPGQYMNRPANSLREIHLLWIPQTHATLDQRLRALDSIRKHESNAAWKLMLGVLPQGQDMSSPSQMPRWRDFSVDRVEVATYAVIGRGAVEISKRLVADVGTNASRWSDLLDRFTDLVPDAEQGLAALEAAERLIADPDDRATLWGRLRHVLSHHRQFPDADWSMKEDILGRLDAIYKRFAPVDPLERAAWLFEPRVELPDPSTEGWQSRERDVDAARRQTAKELFSKGGAKAILALARLVSTAGYIGQAIYETGLPEHQVDALLEAALLSDHTRELDLAYGLIRRAFRDRKEDWATGLISRAREEGWGDEAVLTILAALPQQAWTWGLAAQCGQEIEDTYWRRAPVFWSSDSKEEAAFAIRKLVAVGRARHALVLAERGGKLNLPSDLLVEVLREALKQPLESQGGSNDAVMFQHNVAEILQNLDSRGDVDMQTLVQLEWAYLPILEHSRRPVKVLMQALSEQPEFFIQMLRAVFKATEKSGVVEEEPQDAENASAVARQAYRLLDLWDRLPGTRGDQTIDGEILEGWIKRARALAKEVGREEIADSRIGMMLSASPVGADGNWPAEPVRDMIDLFRSKRMISGFQIGKQNRRGVTSRGMRDGGALERQEAASYRRWAKAIEHEHPHTAKALDELADSYERQAIGHDEDAERLDWE